MNKAIITTTKLDKTMKGSLPNYIVNLDDFGNLLLEIMNSNKIVDYGKQKIDGIHIKLDGKDEQEIIWQPKEMFAVLTGFEIGLNDCRNIGYMNSIDMFIDDIQYFDDIYFKETDTEYKELSVRRMIKENNQVRFIFKNRDKQPTDLFIHIHYIGDLLTKKYNVICIDKENNKTLLQYPIFVVPPTSFNVCPSEIEEYNILSECVEVDTETYKGTDIIFEYEKVQQVIDHSYDWLIKMHWGILGTDVDLYCDIEDVGLVYYLNKELKIDDDNQAWLDYDYTTPKGEPEIITILGLNDKKAKIGLALYRGNLTSTDIIKLEVFKFDKGNKLVKELEITGDRLQSIQEYFLEIDIPNNIVNEI